MEKEEKEKMKYKYLIQNCDAETLNLSELEPSIKERIKVIFIQDEKGKLVRHWSGDLGSTNSILKSNSIYLLEIKPSCSGSLLPQPESEYLVLSNILPGHSQTPLVEDKVFLKIGPWTSRAINSLSQMNLFDIFVEDSRVINGQVQIKLNTNLSTINTPILLEFFSGVDLPGSVSIENYCLQN